MIYETKVRIDVPFQNTLGKVKKYKKKNGSEMQDVATIFNKICFFKNSRYPKNNKYKC